MPRPKVIKQEVRLGANLAVAGGNLHKRSPNTLAANNQKKAILTKSPAFDSHAATLRDIIETAQLELDREENADLKQMTIVLNGGTGAMTAIYAYSPPHIFLTFGVIVMLAVSRQLYRAGYTPSVNTRITDIIQRAFEDLDSYDPEKMSVKKGNLEKENSDLRNTQMNQLALQLPLSLVHLLFKGDPESRFLFLIVSFSLVALFIWSLSLITKYGINDTKVLRYLKDKKTNLSDILAVFFKEMPGVTIGAGHPKSEYNKAALNLIATFNFKQKSKLYPSLEIREIAKEICWLLQAAGIFAYIKGISSYQILTLVVGHANFKKIEETKSFDFSAILNQRLSFKNKVKGYKKNGEMDKLLEGLEEHHGGKWGWYFKEREDYSLQVCFFQEKFAATPFSPNDDLTVESHEIYCDDIGFLAQEMGSSKTAMGNKEPIFIPFNPGTAELKDITAALHENESRKPEHPSAISVHVTQKTYKAYKWKQSKEKEPITVPKQDGERKGILVSSGENQQMFFPEAELENMQRALEHDDITARKALHLLQDGKCISLSSKRQNGLKFTKENDKPAVIVKSLTSSKRILFCNTGEVSQEGGVKTFTMEYKRVGKTTG
jgi:hypothetical protein